MKNILLLSLFSISIGFAQIKVGSWYESIPTKQRYKIIQKTTGKSLQRKFDQYSSELRLQEKTLRRSYTNLDSLTLSLQTESDTIYYRLYKTKDMEHFDSLLSEYKSKQEQLKEIGRLKDQSEETIKNTEMHIQYDMQVPKTLLDQTLYLFELNGASNEFDMSYYLTEKDLKENYLKLK